MPKITKINGGGSNCYLITENNNSILIDTGMKVRREFILKECMNANVRLIVLTHGHIDHVENAAYLSEKLNAPVAMNKNDLPLLKDNLSRKMKSRGILGNIVRFFSVQSAKHTKLAHFNIDVFLNDGDNLLRDYGVDAEVVELPGHTQGSIGIHVGDKDFIIGDALMHMFRPSISMLYEDRDMMINSAFKIEEFKENVIYFGHGNPVANKKWVSI